MEGFGLRPYFICFGAFEGSVMIECLKKGSGMMKCFINHCWIDLTPRYNFVPVSSFSISCRFNTTQKYFRTLRCLEELVTGFMAPRSA